MTPARAASPAAPLARRIAARIAADGPMTLAEYMAICLSDPAHGYYMRGDPFGAAGDFVTAPEVSQMFGEILGAWAAHVWQLLGAPDPLLLVELGPGRGTLMADVLRTAAVLPAFRRAIRVHLVETSPALRRLQEARLTAAAVPPAWHERLDQVPDGPMILLANEFFDALPIRQFEHRGGGWAERVVGLGAANRLVLGLRPVAGNDPALPAEAPEGAVLEIAPAATAIAATIGERIASTPGAALIIDYGHVRSGYGDTFQAVRRHAYVDPLAYPGEADLTAHVDFAALAAAARRPGVAVLGPITQGTFLTALGIRERAEQLSSRNPAAASGIRAALERLTGETGMGSLFKVMAVGPQGLGLPPFVPETAAAV